MKLRDHSQPCGHRGLQQDWSTDDWPAVQYSWGWECTEDGCPGGREITMNTISWCRYHGSKEYGSTGVCYRSMTGDHTSKGCHFVDAALGVNDG